MAKFNTGNPLGSTDPRDLLDNATIADHYVDDTDSESWPDRFGRERRTWHGMEMDSSRQLSSQEDRFQQFLLSSGYVILPDYVDGPITFTARNQVTAYSGDYYRPKASVSLPFTTTGKDSTSWANDKGNFVSVGDAALRQELSAKDGLKLIGRCPDLATLATIEPEVEWQVIDVIARVKGGTWGGGRFLYIPTATTSMFPAIDGAIIWTTGGNCWIRESLVSAGSLGVIHAEWFADNEPNLVNDWSSAMNAANSCAETMVKSLNPKFGRLCTIKTPQMMGLSNSCIINPNAATLAGGSFIQVTPSANYTAHPQAASKTAAANFTYAIGLISTQISTSSSNFTCYWNRNYANDLTIVCSSNTAPYKMPYAEQKTTPTNYIAAFCHYGYAPTTAETNVTGTVMAAQGSFRDVAVIGFPIGYVNGDYAWGVNFWDCKWIGCYYSQFLISGSDNGERMNFYGNVWQNGVHGVWNEDWEGDGKVIGGSAVWMIGYYFNIKGSAGGWDIDLSRTEYIIQSTSLYSPIVNVEVGASSTTQKFPIVKFRSTLVLVSTAKSSVDSTAFYLFNASKNTTLYVQDSGWQFQAWTSLPGISLVNPSATGIVRAKNNGPVRIGSHAQWGRVPALSMVSLNAGDCSQGVSQMGTDTGFSYAFDTSAGTLTLKTTAATSATIHLFITVPLDNKTDFNNLIPWLNFASISLTTDCYATMSLGHSQMPTSKRSAFAAINLNSRQASYANLFPYYAGSTVQPVWKRRDELGYIPDQLIVDFWIPSGTATGSLIVLNKAHLGGV